MDYNKKIGIFSNIGPQHLLETAALASSAKIAGSLLSHLFQQCIFQPSFPLHSPVAASLLDSSFSVLKTATYSPKAIIPLFIVLGLLYLRKTTQVSYIEVNTPTQYVSGSNLVIDDGKGKIMSLTVKPLLES